MARGGPRTNSGPPPDPNALRRDRPSDKDGWTSLPAEGRTGRTPKWPLPPEIMMSSALGVAQAQREIVEAQLESGEPPKGATAKLAQLDQRIALLEARLAAAAKMEGGLWRSLWKTPQSVAWERLRWTREVALYVRWQVLAELGDIDAAKEARQWSDRLGLNPASLMRNRWKIVAAAAPSTRTGSTTRSSSRERFTVVTGGGAE